MLDGWYERVKEKEERDTDERVDVRVRSILECVVNEGMRRLMNADAAHRATAETAREVIIIDSDNEDE